MRFKYVLTVVCLFAVLALTTVYAQDIWLGGTGNWSNAASWSMGIVPNGSTVDVRIDGGNPINSVVTFDLSNGSVGTLLVDPDDALNIDGALTSYYATLTSGTLGIDIGGSLNNNGLLNNYNVLNNSGSLNNNGLLNNGGTLNNQFGILTNSGTLNNNSGATLVNPYMLNNSGTLNNGGTLNNQFGILTNSGTLNNSGTLTMGIEGGGVNNSGTLNNSGTMDFVFGSAIFGGGGTLNNFGSMTFDDSRLSSDTLNNPGYIVLLDESLAEIGTLINSGWLTILDGTLYSGPVYNSGMLGFEESGYGATIVNIGSPVYNSGTISSDVKVNNYGPLYNSGTLNIGIDGTLNNQGTYTQSAGATVVDGAFSSVTPIQINGGTLSGSGLIQGDVIMGGTMSPGESPGDSPGVLTIQGNYTQLSSGTFFAELAGLTPGTQYDQLMVSGLATLDGTLDVVLLNGFIVRVGDSFVLMTFGSESGQFSLLDLPSLPAGEMWRLSYNATDLTLSAVPSPEPGSLLLLGTGLLGAVGVFRRMIDL